MSANSTTAGCSTIDSRKKNGIKISSLASLTCEEKIAISNRKYTETNRYYVSRNHVILIATSNYFLLKCCTFRAKRNDAAPFKTSSGKQTKELNYFSRVVHHLIKGLHNVARFPTSTFMNHFVGQF